eukprot:2808081-Karenia_brevis.AAC.1
MTDSSGAASSQQQTNEDGDNTDTALRAEHLEDSVESPLKVLRKQEEPTAEERRRHEIDHLPYAPWCRSCVAGRGKADQHVGKDHDEDA